MSPCYLDTCITRLTQQRLFSKLKDSVEVHLTLIEKEVAEKMSPNARVTYVKTSTLTYQLSAVRDIGLQPKHTG